MNTIKAQTPPKMLVVYYSWSPAGNTRVMAEKIQSATGADIFEVVPVASYPTEYRATTEQARAEINRDYRPAIKANAENIADYDIIFVGSPCWWSTIAPPMATFLATHDLSGKTVMPFMTHEGSRMGRSVSDIRELAPNSTVTNGLAIRGGNVNNSSTASDIAKWLRDNSITE